MKSKILLSLFVLIALTASLFAKEISLSKAEKVAVNFFFEQSNQYGSPVDYFDISIRESYQVDQAYYVINFENGWVIVAANDVMTPVLGYNLSGTLPSVDAYNENFSGFMQGFADQVGYIQQNNLEPDAEIAALWQEIENLDASATITKGDREVAPLLTSTWNQDDPYNMLCPEDAAGPGGRVYVGCVATAMSMIMHYWRYPLQGSGQHSYYIYPYGTQTVNYAASTYEWNGMQDNINNKFIWEMAQIGYHAAVGVDMGFSPEGSVAYSADVPGALASYFGYSPTMQYISKSGYTTIGWESQVQSELNQMRPIYYSGSSSEGGHAFACDGYQDDSYYHFNFGWSGSGNGFFTLTDVGGYNTYQGMIRNFFPADANYPYIATGTTDLEFLAGSFTDGSGPIEDYPTGMDAQWLIAPQTDQDSVSKISVHFVQFNTAASDMLRIYDGSTTSAPLLGEYSGTTLPDNITSTGNEVLVTFSSTGTGEGFKIEYNAMLPTYCTGTQIFDEATGTITDGSGSFYYNNLSTCTFFIQHPEGVNYHIEFAEFNTEAGKDKLTIYDASSQLIGEYSGNTLPDDLNIASDGVFITWGTNAYIRESGWSLNYTIDGVGIEEPTIYENLSVFPNPTTGELNISFDVEKAGKLQVRMTNLSGQVVIDQELGSFNGKYTNSFNLSDQAKGVYLLSIISEKGKTDRKIVLQ